MGFRLRCSFSSSTNGSAARSPTAASITAPTPITSPPAGSKPPITAPTKPSNRSSICWPLDPSLAIVELFLFTILGAGDSCAVAAGEVHAEHVGPQGVAFITGRRKPAA
jgi:hypothetical protein